ncbi:MAG: tRNA (guanosine(37)-N1)-methyltransferase TrmD [Thermodesulfobacteriota bacterium]
MKYDVLTIFPEFFESPLRQGIIRRAIENGLLEVEIHNIRDYAHDRHKTTDDSPYGGGAGMLMKVEPTVEAIDAVRNGSDEKVILVTPQGAPLNQEVVNELSGLKKLIVVCGRYEGVDERIRDFVDMEISIGDYVLMGGEIPALVILESVTRLIPGVLGSHESVETESFSNGLLEYPQYTRPGNFRGLKVPSVLLSGNHKEIERWRQQESLKRTLERRPELIGRQSKQKEL